MSEVIQSNLEDSDSSVDESIQKLERADSELTPMELFYLETSKNFIFNLVSLSSMAVVGNHLGCAGSILAFSKIFETNLFESISPEFYLTITSASAAVSLVSVLVAMKVFGRDSFRTIDFPEEYRIMANLLIEAEKQEIPLPEVQTSLVNPLIHFGKILHQSRKNRLPKSPNQFKQFNKYNSNQPGYYLEYTGRKFLSKTINESTQTLASSALAILVSEILANQVLGFSMLNSELSSVFQAIMIVGVVMLIGLKNWENYREFIYGEDYVKFTNSFETLEIQMNLEMLELQGNRDPYALLGYLLIKSR